MELGEFVSRLDDELRTDDYADLDASANGLQVGPSNGTIETAAFAVDAAVETAEAAVAAEADILVTHHGYVFGGLDRVTGREYDRIQTLIGGDCALYVSHLPLDGHQTHGNAAGLADLLDLQKREPFGELGTEHIGQRGVISDPRPLSELISTLARELAIGPGQVRSLDFGPNRVTDIAIVTGSGVDWIDEAVDQGTDVLITGEGKQQAYHRAREAGLNVVLAGHYATETFGVRSLAGLAEDWGVETVYIDRPTGL